MRNLVFYLLFVIVVVLMNVLVKKFTGIDDLPTSVAIVIGTGSGLLAGIGYTVAKLEDLDE